MKTIKKNTILILGIFLFSVCTKEEILPEFSINKNTVSFIADGGEENIELTSSVDWSASSNHNWLTISPSNGSQSATLKLSATSNNTPTRRTGTVTILTNDMGSLEVQVSQSAGNLLLEASKTEVSFIADGGEETVELTANVNWTATSNQDWLTVGPLNGIGDTNILLSATENTSNMMRVASITLTPQTGDPLLIHVTQEGASLDYDLLRYVSPDGLGNKDGLSETDAADFLDGSFWSKINNELKSNSVEVRFLSGEYIRAFSEKSLYLTNIGNPDNVLLLQGNDEVMFPAPKGFHDEENSHWGQQIRISGGQNIIISNFNFTGGGKLGYSLRIVPVSGTGSNNNILIENCSWIDMRGIVYGATGAHTSRSLDYKTSNIVYNNCVFKRIGIDSHSHHMYHAHSVSNLKILNCHFEDCTGDHIRFRDNCDYIVVDNCNFVHNQGFDTRNSPYIGVPLFNSRGEEGDEYFATNFSITNNRFTSKPGVNTNIAIYFGNWGFSTPEFNYLLTREEGNTLVSGTKEEKISLINNNFDIDVKKIRVSNNTFTGNISNKFVLRSEASYGSVSLGWVGYVDILDLLNNSSTPYRWEDFQPDGDASVGLGSDLSGENW